MSVVIDCPTLWSYESSLRGKIPLNFDLERKTADGIIRTDGIACVLSVKVGTKVCIENHLYQCVPAEKCTRENNSVENDARRKADGIRAEHFSLLRVRREESMCGGEGRLKEASCRPSV